MKIKKEHKTVEEVLSKGYFNISLPIRIIIISAFTSAGTLSFFDKGAKYFGVFIYSFKGL